MQQALPIYFNARKEEADSFYDEVLHATKDPEWKRIQRQALSGILWSKQYYHYDVERWLTTSDGITDVNPGKLHGRNAGLEAPQEPGYYFHARQMGVPLVCRLGPGIFQCIPLAMVDPAFAKHQLLLIMRNGI